MGTDKNGSSGKMGWQKPGYDDRNERRLLFSSWTVAGPFLIAILFLLITLIHALFAHRAIADEKIFRTHREAQSAAAIIYGEAAGDPRGWEAILNTYYKARRPGESFLHAMRRVSCAHRMRSIQYTKARTGLLNSYEKTVYNRILRTVESFRPDPVWKYVHHEYLGFYRDRRAAMRHLRSAWGPRVDLEHGVMIGKEHYFEEV